MPGAKGAVIGIARTDLSRLGRLVGTATVARGRACARSGAVREAVWDPSGRRVEGTVDGRGGRPHQVSVTLTRRPGGPLAALAGSCSCPIGRDCEHVVALLIAPPTTPGTRPSTGKPAGAWMAALEALVSDSGRPRTGSVVDPSPEALGLQFELIVAGTGGGMGVALRPVTLSDRGNWVRSQVSWGTLDYFRGRRPGRDRPLELLKELRSMALLTGRSPWAAPRSEGVRLETIGSRRVWDLLAEAGAAGLALVGSGARPGPVTVEATPATVALDLCRRSGGELEVTARLAANRGRPNEAEGCLLVGQPPHGAVWWHDEEPAASSQALYLAALDAPVPDALASLLVRPDPLVVPADHVDRFEAQVYPVLARRVQVGSADGSYALPELAPDRVVCRLAHEPGPALEVTWALVAGTGPPRVVDDDPDPDAEKVLRRATDILGADRHPLIGAGPNGPQPAGGRLSGLDAARFMTETVPELLGLDGLELVEVGDAPDYREITDAPLVRMVAPAPTGSGTDWLDLAVEVTVGGETVPFEALFVALSEGAEYLMLASGGYLALDRPELHQLASLIAEARALHDAPPGQVRLSRFQTSLYEDLATLARMEGVPDGWADSVRALAAGANRRRRRRPAGLRADLRPYQLDGYRWLADRFERGVGAVLADDMGLGKTLQALALICHARRHHPESGAWLVVAPTSVVAGWVTEAARFAPRLDVAAVTATAARRGTTLAEATAGADVVITSYALFRLEFDQYQQHGWAGLLLDEAQFVKNPASRGALLARKLECGWKLAMTGTPLENSLAELWSLMAITCPGLLGRPDRFHTAYRHPIERSGDSDCLDRLRRRLRPVMLRRTKAEVLDELPDKQELVVELDLDPRHRRLYETHLQRQRQKLLGLIGDMQANRFEILRSLTVLRQAALDPALVEPLADRRGPKATREVPSTKLDHLEQFLAEAVADGHRVLVFSQFTRFLSQARQRAEAAGLATCYLDGRTRDRAAVIERFRSGEVPVFFISLKAGGFGLNLTEADHAVLLDPWWNPATETQAIDRLHRIGQTRKVMVHRLIARDTIEEKVMALKERKAALFDRVMGGGRFASTALDAADVEALLA